MGSIEYVNKKYIGYGFRTSVKISMRHANGESEMMGLWILRASKLAAFLRKHLDVFPKNTEQREIVERMLRVYDKMHDDKVLSNADLMDSIFVEAEGFMPIDSDRYKNPYNPNHKNLLVLRAGLNAIIATVMGEESGIPFLAMPLDGGDSGVIYPAMYPWEDDNIGRYADQSWSGPMLYLILREPGSLTKEHVNSVIEKYMHELGILGIPAEFTFEY